MWYSFTIPWDVLAKSTTKWTYSMMGYILSYTGRYANSPSREKYYNQKKKRKEKPPTQEEMVRRAHQRIIGAVQKKGKGIIYAATPKEALRILREWVRNDDGLLGKGQQVTGVLRKAFGELCQALVFRRTSYGFRLSPHNVVPAA